MQMQRHKIRKPARPRRQAYDASFKLKVIYEALRRPAGARIKPTCRNYPDIEPVRATSAEPACQMVPLVCHSTLPISSPVPPASPPTP